MQMFRMRYEFYTLDVYEVIYKARLEASLHLGGMRIWGKTSVLIWSNIPRHLPLKCKSGPGLALWVFRRPGVSIHFWVSTTARGWGLCDCSPPGSVVAKDPFSATWGHAQAANRRDCGCSRSQMGHQGCRHHYIHFPAPRDPSWTSSNF